MKNLLIADGNSLLNRAFYGIRPLTARDGTPTNAVYGFINILKKHVDALKPEYMVCAFDMKAPTFRHKQYPAYKANRKPMPEDLAKQLPIAKEAAAALGFRVLECEGFEADDIIGTVCGIGDKAGDVHSFALTGDRDSLQLITETTSVILVKTKEDIVFTPERFEAEYGVTPRQYLDVKALMGDPSDNIPGVRGIGEKGAFRLINVAGSLDALYSGIDNIQLGKAVKDKLVNGKVDAFMSRKLAEIVKNAPIGNSVSEFESTGPDKDKLRPLFERLDFTAMAKRFGLDEEKKPSLEINFPSAEITPPERLESFVKNSAPELAAEYDGKSLYVSDGERIFEFQNPTSEQLEMFFKEKKIICHDYKKLCRALSPLGIRAECTFDSMLAGYLLSPGNGNYPVLSLTKEYTRGAPSEISSAGIPFAAFKLKAPMTEKLRRENMENLLFDIEIPLARVLADMEDAGMKIDCKGLAEYSMSLKETQTSIVTAIYEAAGHEFNINSPKQLAAVLFDELHLPVKKKTKSGPSTNAEVLAALRPYHEIVDYIIRYREITKLISTYSDVLPAAADKNGRVHTTFHQTGAATGRLSSSDPNLQNIPVRGQTGREIRKYFTAEPGKVLIDADYSQIELRVLAEISGDENMKQAFLSGEDIHTSTATQVFGVSPLMVDGELRRRAKAVNFGIVYGIGAFSLSKDLGISRDQAAKYIQSYLETYPAVEKYLNETVDNAKKNRYTVTRFGRRRPIPELSSANKNVKSFGERIAMNSPIQGTAADIIKAAMVNTAAALEKSGLDARLIMQVHDELIVEAAESDAEAAGKILKYEMENVFDSSVPMSVEISSGKNWYEAK